MSRAIQIWLRNAAAVVFSTTIGFLVLALFWQFYRELSPNIVVFAALAGLAILVVAIFASISAGAELNWNAVASGCMVGLVAMGSWWVAQTSLLVPVPYTILLPLTLSSLTVAAAVETLPAREEPLFYNTSRFVALVHLLQGVFLFGILLPSAMAWQWPRPFAAALICSAYLLGRLWRGCPLTMAENQLREREGMEIIPPDEGFIKDLLGGWGIPVTGTAVGVALNGIGISLCSWWGIEWLVVLFTNG